MDKRADSSELNRLAIDDLDKQAVQAETSRRLHLRFNLGNEAQRELWRVLSAVPPGKRMVHLLSMVTLREREDFEERLIRRVQEAIEEGLRGRATAPASSSPGSLPVHEGGGRIPGAEAAVNVSTIPDRPEGGEIPPNVMAYLQDL